MHRILCSLQKLGYIEKGDAKAYYRLGPRYFKLAEHPVPFRRLQAVAKPVMTDLLVQFSETVNLGVLHDGLVTYIEVLQSPSALRMAAHPGERNPIHSCSLGKAIAAFLPEEEVAAIIDRRPLIKKTSRTITQRSHFLDHLGSVRKQALAFDLEETLDGVICVGAPILDQRGRAVASLSISGPASRMESKLGAMQDKVKEAGLKISQLLAPRHMTSAKSSDIGHTVEKATGSIVGAPAATA